MNIRNTIPTFAIVLFSFLWYGGFAIGGGWLAGNIAWGLTHSFIVTGAGIIAGGLLGVVAGFIASLIVGAVVDWFIL